MQPRSPGASRRAFRAAAVAVALSLGLAACGGGSDDDAAGERKVKPLGEILAGSVAPLAQCKDWVGGARDRKLATIDDIRNQVNRRDTGIESPALSDEEALGLFDRACSNSYAKSFRLYVLYARAAGFAPLERDGAVP
jgi:hypothetical protein